MRNSGRPLEALCALHCSHRPSLTAKKTYGGACEHELEAHQALLSTLLNPTQLNSKYSHNLTRLLETVDLFSPQSQFLDVSDSFSESNSRYATTSSSFRQPGSRESGSHSPICKSECQKTPVVKNWAINSLPTRLVGEPRLLQKVVAMEPFWVCQFGVPECGSSDCHTYCHACGSTYCHAAIPCCGSVWQ